MSDSIKSTIIMLMVPKIARAHSIKLRVVPKSAVARERVKTIMLRIMIE